MMGIGLLGKRLVKLAILVMAVVAIIVGSAGKAFAAKAADTTVAEPLKSSGPDEAKALRALDQNYQLAASIKMDVKKKLKLGLLGQERESKGRIQLSSGRLRMELEGAEHSLLVINKKKFWAVTFPSVEFKNASVQVVEGEVAGKAARAQNLVSVLTRGGFSKYFKLVAVQAQADGTTIYFLQPQGEQSDFKRAQLTVSKDGQRILALRYWDERDNETELSFSSIVFGNKALPEKLFSYDPPKNADVMKY